MFHSVTQYSAEGHPLETFDSINDAIKSTGENRSSILQQIDGRRKYCFWHSHIYRNNIILRNGTIIEVSRHKHLSTVDIEGIWAMSKALDDMGLKMVMK